MIDVRPWHKDDIPYIINYFLEADEEYIKAMGADPDKLPSFDSWSKSLNREINLPPEAQQYFYMIWMLDDLAVGHCNVNYIRYGHRANMHLHLWQSDKRRSGLGATFVGLSIPNFFKRFDLQELYCEPYAENPAPNKTLPKVGFEFVKRYNCTPGPINFQQDVCQYRILKDMVLSSGSD